MVLPQKDDKILQNLYWKSMPDRIKALTASEGGPTKYIAASACDENNFKVASLVT